MWRLRQGSHELEKYKRFHKFSLAGKEKEPRKAQNMQITGPLPAPRRAPIRGASWGVAKHWKCIDFHRFSIIIFKQHNKKHGKHSSAGCAQAACPYVGCLAARPCRSAARPPPCGRVANARNASEIYKNTEFYILQTMKSMKRSWHSFKNIKLPSKTLKNLLSRFAGDCCIALLQNV